MLDLSCQMVVAPSSFCFAGLKGDVRQRSADSAVLQAMILSCREGAIHSKHLNSTIAGPSCAFQDFPTSFCVLLLTLCAHHASKTLCIFVLLLP